MTHEDFINQVASLTHKNLINQVASESDYLDSGFRKEHILQAMRKVNRKEFIPDIPIPLNVVDESSFQKLRESVMKIETKKQEHQALSLPDIQEMMFAAYLVSTSAKGITVSQKDLAYTNDPLDIGYHQTCSQPSMVALMVDILDLKPGMKVLEIGTGCGYHAAVTAELVGAAGKVYSIEFIPELALLAQDNLQQHFGENYEQRVTVIQGDGSLGLVERAPFDAIYLTAGVRLDHFEPGLLAQQLKLPGGVLLYPEEYGLLIREKYGRFGNIEDIHFYQGVSFVPLRGVNGESQEGISLLRKAQ